MSWYTLAYADCEDSNQSAHPEGGGGGGGGRGDRTPLPPEKITIYIGFL